LRIHFYRYELSAEPNAGIRNPGFPAVGDAGVHEAVVLTRMGLAQEIAVIIRLCKLAFLGAVLLGGSIAALAQAPVPVAQMSDSPCPPPAPARDFAGTCHYKSENAAVLKGAHPTAIFMGDSITEGWRAGDPSLFNHAVLDRGISGQTSPQMLVRFYQDVVALHPRAVHIMAGTNDVAGNTGPSSPEDFKNNIRAMVDLAKTNHIRVILASIPPAERFPWRLDIQPVEQIQQLNAWLRQFAEQHKLIYADYYSSLTTPSGAFRAELSNDGVHPNSDGYAAMRPIADAALRKAMHSSPWSMPWMH
jgi:lysophospholipase L1-like esterase